MRILRLPIALRRWLTATGCALLLAACADGNVSISVPSTPPVPPLSSTAALAQFDFLWSTFDRHYAYFVYKGIDWDVLRARYRSRAEQARTQDALNAVLIDILSKLHDSHVALFRADGTRLATHQPTAFVNWDAAVAQQYASRLNAVNVAPDLAYARVNGGAYISVATWQAGRFTEADIDKLLDAVRDSAALILDLRMNTGGNEALAGSLATRLTSATRIGDYVQTRNGPGRADFTPLEARSVMPRGDWQYTRPILLLIGRRTGSTSESLVAFLHTLPNVTVVGDTTAGSSGLPRTFTLTDGWTFSVSTRIEYTPERVVIEDKGIAPSVVVPATQSDFAAGIDPVLDYALSRLPNLQ
jgi:hypothetical protein